MGLEEAKHLLERYSGLERDALHVHGSLMLYIVSMAVFRQNRRSLYPWMIVLGAEVVNEFFDLLRHWFDGPHDAIAESLKDLWNTMIWPSILLLVGRYTNWFEKSGGVDGGARGGPADAGLRCKE